MAGFVVMDISQEDYDAEIRAKAIEEFANWLVDNNMLVAKEDNMRTVSDVVKAFNEQLEGGVV